MNFLAAFNGLKEYLATEVPEIGEVITHWEDPLIVTTNRTIMLPDAHTLTDNGGLNFSVILWVSTVENNADAIAQTQIQTMEKIFEAIYGDIPSPILSAGINSADYFDPSPQNPTVGIMRIVIGMTTNYTDDCGRN